MNGRTARTVSYRMESFPLFRPLTPQHAVLVTGRRLARETGQGEGQTGEVGTIVEVNAGEVGTIARSGQSIARTGAGGPQMELVNAVQISVTFILVAVVLSLVIGRRGVQVVDRGSRRFMAGERHVQVGVGAHVGRDVGSLEDDVEHGSGGNGLIDGEAGEVVVQFVADGRRRVVVRLRGETETDQTQRQNAQQTGIAKVLLHVWCDVGESVG